MTIKEIHQIFLESAGVCTDTRSLQKNQLFFALKGDNFNGNKYAKQALENGASYAIIDEAEFDTTNTILVKDVLSTLQELAAFHRDYLGIPIIAITGSNGKTTTKELLNAVLSTTFKTYATPGNLNNHIGVPLSLLAITKEHELAIIEMGANHKKEIESYCQWAKPNYGLIGNIGKAHLEGFGSIQGIIESKSELYDAVEQNNGTIFYNLDDEVITSQSKKVSKRLSYGAKNADYSYSIDASQTFVAVKFDDLHVQSHLIGTYNGVNMGAAIAVGKYFKVSNENIKEALENYIPANNRSQIIDYKGNQVILDAYNANPTSMQAALESFSKIATNPKIVFLGDMFEVGNSSSEEHLKVIDLLSKLNFDKAILVGKHFYEHKNDTFHFFETTAEAKKWLEQQEFKNYTILIKGSRGMKMESLIA